MGVTDRLPENAPAGPGVDDFHVGPSRTKAFHNWVSPVKPDERSAWGISASASAGDAGMATARGKMKHKLRRIKDIIRLEAAKGAARLLGNVILSRAVEIRRQEQGCRITKHRAHDHDRIDEADRRCG